MVPDVETLDRSPHHVIELEASVPGSDVTGKRSLFARFLRPLPDECLGMSPVIEHSQMTTLSGSLDYTVRARFGDVRRFREPPIVAYREEGSLLLSSHWYASAFTVTEAGDWEAKIPNLGLSDGQEARLQYRILATSDSDANGSRCDRTATTETFTAIVRGGADSGPLYASCSACRTDNQCDGAGNACLLIEGQGYCMGACGPDDRCADGFVCVEVESIDGAILDQCVPTDLNCGQVCARDALEGETGNNTPEMATPLETGQYGGLTVCENDVDYYRFEVEAGQSLSVRAGFMGEANEVALTLIPPNSTGIDSVESSQASASLESVLLECVRQTGTAYVGVRSIGGRHSDYSLDASVGTGRCTVQCTPDSLEVSGMPAELEEPITLGLRGFKMSSRYVRGTSTDTRFVLLGPLKLDSIWLAMRHEARCL